MKFSFLRILPACVLLTFGAASYAQTSGAVEVSARVKIGTKVEKLKRKRFYLFAGGLEANNALVERIKSMAVVTKDCYYCQAKASTEFAFWMKAGDCESPFCREITTEDIAKVPEFQAAYQKSLKQYGNKPAVAQKWLTTNLAPALRDGFYVQRKAATNTILGSVRPVQSTMTDSVTIKAVFVDIPVQAAVGKSQMFLISNLVPIEVGDKSYVWACEVDVTSDKTAKLTLQVPETGKTIKRCEVVIRDLAVCNAGTCGPK